MRAAVLTGARRPLEFRDVRDPEPAPDEVLIETRSCGICRTDLHIQDGTAYTPALPHILGHEPAGVVRAVGSKVSRLRVGDRVIPHLFVYDEDQTQTSRPAPSRQLRGVIGVTLPGAFAEYFTAPARNLLPLPEKVPFEVGGLTSCAIITAVHAYRKARLDLLSKAGVLGTGGIGLVLLQLLKAAGVSAAAADQSPERMRAAAAAGAEVTVDAHDSSAADTIRAWAGEGVDCVFDLVGRSASLNFAASVCRPGARIIVIGEEDECPQITSTVIAQRELEILGSRNGTQEDALFALSLLERGTLQPVIAARYPLDKVNEAFAHVRGGKAIGRVVVTMER